MADPALPDLAASAALLERLVELRGLLLESSQLFERGELVLLLPTTAQLVDEVQIVPLEVMRDRLPTLVPGVHAGFNVWFDAHGEVCAMPIEALIDVQPATDSP